MSAHITSSLLVVVLSLAIQANRKKIKKLLNLFLLILLIIGLFIFIGYSYNVGTDFWEYRRVFFVYKKYSFVFKYDTRNRKLTIFLVLTVMQYSLS